MWVHEGRGNTAELEEQTFEAPFSAAFPPSSVPGGPVPDGTDPVGSAKSPHPPGPLACCYGVQGGPDGIVRNLCSLASSQNVEPNHEL